MAGMAQGKTSGPRLLLVEDDADLCGLLERLLTAQGYDVVTARDGQQGLHRGLVEEWDVMVIDLGLPAIEGLDLVARLRTRSVPAPVLILTARDTVADRVHGLDAGAQDYLGKPFDVEELLARLRALLRPRSGGSDALAIGRGELRISEARAVVDGDSVELSRRETQLLAVMARSPRRVFSREDLLGLVFEDAETPGSVDTYVYYLRRKLGRGVVDTVHGLGYRLGPG